MVAHTGFIVAAFAITALVVGIMIFAVIMDHRSLKRALARFPGRDGEGEGA